MMRTILLPAFLLLTLCSAIAQEFDKSPDYIAFIKKNHKDIYTEVSLYVNKLELGSNPAGTEAQRKLVLKKLAPVIVSIHGMPAYKNDKSLQDSLAAYMRRTYWLLDKEYPKIQRSQDSANRTYPAAVKFVSAKKKAIAKLIDDENKFFSGLKSFSSTYGVPVPPSYDNEYEKLLLTNDVANHHNTLQLIYSKCKNQEAPLEKAIAGKRKIEIEEHSTVLAKSVKEGYAILDTIKPYKQDKSLIEATRALLNFYQIECEFKVPGLIQSLTRGGDDQVKGNSEVVHNNNVENPEGFTTYGNTQKDIETDRAVAVEGWKKASQTFLTKNLTDK